MASISELGYLGVGVSDANAWQEIATSILGMQVLPGDDRTTFYLRLDALHHRLELHANGGDDLEFAGWEVPDAETLDSVAGQLRDGGVKVTVGSRDEADQRRVIGLIKCVDPAGIPTEIFFGRPVNLAPFYPSRPTSGSRLRAKGSDTSGSWFRTSTRACASTVISSGSGYRISPMCEHPTACFG